MIKISSYPIKVKESHLFHRNLTFYAFLSVLLLSTSFFPSFHSKKTTEKVLTFTILYDNYVHKEGTKADWGFACLIEGLEKTILLDTGTQSDILFYNIQQLDVDIQKIDKIFITHIHGDHTGGLLPLLDKMSSVDVYIPDSFPDNYIHSIQRKGAKVIEVKKPVKICNNAFSTGEMGDTIKEQSLIINTKPGVVLITGCSHPGIVQILQRVKKLYDKPILLVFGGFHLMRKSEAELINIIQDFQRLGVQQCGATHCTGDKAIDYFKNAFAENYITMGTGKVIQISL